MKERYAGWAHPYILFHGKRHPAHPGRPWVTAFLSDLAVQRHVSPSTRNQARNALLPPGHGFPDRNKRPIS